MTSSYFLSTLPVLPRLNISAPTISLPLSAQLCSLSLSTGFICYPSMDRFSGYRCFKLWRYLHLLFILIILNSKGILSHSQSEYLVGLGSYDITGPASDVGMMGFTNIEQIASGIHFRLQARTFIIAQPDGQRIVFVNLDACMASQIVMIKTVERLKKRYGDDLYNEKNVAISGIHTHAGPGGYLQYVVYILTTFGFVRQSFDVIVDGIEKSIIEAHENLRPGSVFMNTGDLLDAGINRSPSAYLNNPEAERRKYIHDIETEMTLLKFVDNEWGPIGSFNWFSTHGTSMSRTNGLISGDNKGAASRFMEDWARDNDFLEDFQRVYPDSFEADNEFRVIPRRVSNIIPPNDKHEELMELASSFPASRGKPAPRILSSTKRVRSVFQQGSKPKFVSAFCQSNSGDISPNVLGTFCIDTGLHCDFNSSTCDGKNELCYGRGPGYPDEFESTRIIGDRQFKKAIDLFKTASKQLKGKVDYRHSYVDFSNLEVKLTSNLEVKTCPAALGFSVAAGTTDGPGAFDFQQGDDQGNAFWRLVRDGLKIPGKKQAECHKPKPILVDVGEMTKPYMWTPSILPIQILRIGQLVILSTPGEFTTMAGRRLRDAVKAVLTGDNGGEFGRNLHVVIAGLTNTYSQYVTTFEEYEVQRYEGASTLFGPYTLDAYIQEFKRLASSMLNEKSIPSGPQPPDLLDNQIELLPGVVLDTAPLGKKFGDVASDIPKNSSFKRGDMAMATFWSACPRNDLLTEGTFSLVEFLDDGKNWVPVYDDDDWCLRFIWSRPWKLSSHSKATIEWRIPETAVRGVYRIRHFGASKNLLGSIKHFTGTSSAFVVI